MLNLRFLDLDLTFMIWRSDIRMPEMNGFQLCRKLREIDKKIKLCFLTAAELLYYRDTESDIINELGSDCFVAKPVDTIVLINRLKIIL